MTFMIDLENFYFEITYRADFECVQIELAKNYGVNEWREDLRKVMMKAGLENNPTVFLFSDTQVSFCRRSHDIFEQIRMESNIIEGCESTKIVRDQD